MISIPFCKLLEGQDKLIIYAGGGVPHADKIAELLFDREPYSPYHNETERPMLYKSKSIKNEIESIGDEGGNMRLDPVDSSMVAAAGYDADLRTLVILFNSGKAYQYLEVPPEVYQGFLAASSKGRYLLENVIDYYPYAVFKGWKNIPRQPNSIVE